MIKIDLTKNGFETVRHKYKFLTEISIDRFIVYQKHEPEFTFGLTWDTIYDKMIEIYNHLNRSRLMDAGIIVKEILDNVGTNKAKAYQYDGMLMLATIFIVREDEDIEIFSYDVAKQKIDDWKGAGIDYSSFFSFVANCTRNYITKLEEISQSTSEQIEKQVKEIKSQKQ